MSLADYLAKNYLSADGTKKKKKSKDKKKVKTSESSQIIAADDISGWDQPSINEHDDDQEDEDEQNEQDEQYERPHKQGKWKRVGSEVKDELSDAPRMLSGARAGLQTADQIQKDIEKKQAAELLEMEKMKKHVQSETVYRDATGRRLDIKQQQLEAQRQEEEAKAKEEKFQKEINAGWVQRADARQEKEQLDSLKFTSMHRYADDSELNELQKKQDRFNDPAAMFLKDKKPKGRSVSQSTGLPNYAGHYEPNRFNIPPGAKWDGVDRSGGFEAKWFQRQNEIRSRKHLEYSMSVDV